MRLNPMMHLKVDTKLTTSISKGNVYTPSHKAEIVERPRGSGRHVTKWQPTVAMISTSVNPSDASHFSL